MAMNWLAKLAAMSSPDAMATPVDPQLAEQQAMEEALKREVMSSQPQQPVQEEAPAGSEVATGQMNSETVPAIEEQPDISQELMRQAATIQHENQKRLEPYLKAQGDEANKLAEVIAAYSQRPTGGLNLAPLLQAVSRPGENLAAGYEKPLTEDEKLKTLATLQNMAVGARSKITDAQVDALKATDQLKMLAAMQRGQGTDRRAKEARDYNREKELQKEAEAYSKRTENLPSLKYSLDELDKLVPAQGEIPGVGVGKARLPGFVLSPEGQKIRQNARDVMIAKVYLTSGKTINESEADRLLESVGLKWDSTPESFRSGIRNLRNSIRQEVKQKQAGYQKEAMDIARSRGSLTLDDFKEESKKSSAPQADDRQKRLQELRAKRDAGTLGK